MAEGGIFLDIFARLNLASVDRVLRDVKTAMREGGASAGRDFSEGLTAGLRDVSKAADVAFRDMQTGLARLQVAEAQINNLRAQNFKASTDAMIAAQKELDAAILNSHKLMETSVAKSGEVAVLGRRGREEPDVATPRGGRDRSPVIPVPRAANRAGAGVSLGLAGILGYGVGVDARVQSNINQIRSAQQGMSNRESDSNLLAMTQWSYRSAGNLGPNSSAQNLSNALQAAEAMGYRGQAAMDMVSTSFKESTITGANFGETLKALDTQLRDVGETTDKTAASLQQMVEASSQNVRALANAKLTSPEQRTQFFTAMHSYEPSLAALSPGANPTDLLAQGQAMMLTLMQTGMGPEQAGTNLNHLLQNLNMQPGSRAFKTFAQLGGNSQGLANILNTQGPEAALQMINQVIQSRTFTNGEGQTMVHTGIQMNQQQLQEAANTMLQSMDDQARAYVESHPEVAGGLAKPFSLRKAVESGQLSGDEAQDVLQYSRAEGGTKGFNKYLQAGGESDMTPAQLAKFMFGSGDINRTFTILNQNAQALADRLKNILQGGQENVLEQSFKQAMSGDMLKRWHALGDAAGGLAGRMSNDLLPVLSAVVTGFRGVIDFLGKHKIIADDLLVSMGAIAAMWAAAKTINLFTGIQQSFAKLSTATTELAGAESVTAGEIAAAGTEMAGAGLGGALRTAAANVAQVFSVAALTALLYQGFNALTNPDNGPGKSVHDWMKDNGMLPGEAPNPPGGRVPGGTGQPPLGHFVAPTPGQKTPTEKFKEWFGFAGGGKVADPYTQPLMGMPDMGGDSVLGMVNGMPVGLRGGEGILTPEAVQALGGKEGIDNINDNPWANPFKVGTTFYGSFAKGVAKYSPWGKYLEASSKGLDALEKEFEESTKIHQRGQGVNKNTIAALMQGMSPQDLASMGITRGKRGGYRLPNGQYIGHGSNYGSSAMGAGSPDTMAAIGWAASNMGLSPSQLNDVKWIFSNESGFDPNVWNKQGSGAFGLGQFLGHEGDKYGALGAYSGDPYKETIAAITYMNDRYGGPAGAKAYWQAHGTYSQGGIVGYAGGGILPMTPPPPPTPTPGPGPGPSNIAPIDQPGSGKPTLPQAMPPIRGNQPAPPPPTGNVAAPHPSNAPRDHVQKDKSYARGHANPQRLLQGGTPEAPQARGDRDIHENPSRPGGEDNTSKGFGVGGGLIGAAESAASMAASAFTFGGGGEVSNMAFQLVNRAIGLGGQYLGIALEGLVETLLPNDSKLGDPTRNLAGKIALGIAGAHKTPQNYAGGKSHMQLKPKQDLDQGAIQGKQVPLVHMDHPTIHNHTADHNETMTAISKGLFQGTGGNIPVAGQ